MVQLTLDHLAGLEPVGELVIDVMGSVFIREPGAVGLRCIRQADFDPQLVRKLAELTPEQRVNLYRRQPWC